MFGVALDLKPEDFKNLIKAPKPALIGIVAQFLILPSVTFLLVWIIEPMPGLALGMMLVAACPGGNISNFMTSLAGGNVALSVSLTAFSTFGALVMTPLNLTFWASLYDPTAIILNSVSLNSLELAKTILLILGCPLVLGMMLQHYRPHLSIVLQKWLKPLSILIFVAFVVIAFLKNMDLFLEYFHYIVYLVLIHNAVAFLTGYSLASAFKLNHRDRKSITVETGIQNSGLGLLLIFSFFEGLGSMAMIAAWWGIWHIISGLLLATFWSGEKYIQSA